MNNWKAQLVEYPVGDLIPYVKNQKKHSDDQINKVAGSIAEFGFTNPIGIDKDKVVVFGHCRLEAAKKLGMAMVPCVVLDHLSESNIKALRIADNKLNESEWDMDFLKFDLQSLKLEGVDLERLGFEEMELSGILGDINFEPGDESDQGQLDQKKPVECPACGEKFVPKG